MSGISSRINTLLLILVLVSLLGVVAMLARDARGGPLDPPAPPASTLPQVEPRSPIPPVGWNGTFPIVISQPGSYFLTRSLTDVSGADGIQIATHSVSLDLNGFALIGVNDASAGSGIRVVGVQSGIRITNGMIRDWFHGIDGFEDSLGSYQAVFSRVEGVTALSNNGTGIRLGFDSEIINCNVSQNNVGISTHFTVVRGCHATDNDSGIKVENSSLVDDNKAFNNSIGIQASGNSTTRRNTSTGNTLGDFNFTGTGNVSDSNVATCPGKIFGTAQTINPIYQRNPC